MANPQAMAIQQFQVQVTTNTAANVALEQQINALQLKVSAGSATEEEKTKLNALQAQLATSKANPPDPTKNNPTSVDGHVVVNGVTKEEYKQTIETPVQNNTGDVHFLELKEGDIVSYINATVFLNPWGRMRQCDDDLIDLMKHVGNDFNNELAEWIQIGKVLADVLTMS